MITAYGGKKRMLPTILPLVAAIPHQISGEPFAGAAAVVFAKPRPAVRNQEAYRAFLNDDDGRLITVYRGAQHPLRRAALLDRLSWTPARQAERERAWTVLDDPASEDQDVAWAVVVVAQQGCSSRLHHRNGWSTARRGANTAMEWDRYVAGLESVTERLRGVAIRQEDAHAGIRRWDSPAPLGYRDPPSVGAAQRYRSRNGWVRQHTIPCYNALERSMGFSHVKEGLC